MDTIEARFFNPETQDTLTLTLPRDTRFSALTVMLQERGFADRRKAPPRGLRARGCQGDRSEAFRLLPGAGVKEGWGSC